MPNYCCFWHPKNGDYEEKTLEDKCPECGRPYGYVLDNLPQRIGPYIIDRAIDRGFYSVVYAAKRGRFAAPIALKVAPRPIYKFYNKDFLDECDKHNEIAKDASYIIQIHDLLEGITVFEKDPLECDVAELDYIDGESLASYLKGHERLPARTIAQIAIDLFKILQELTQRGVNHNDLHSGNILISKLGTDTRRLDGALDDRIRAVVVDFGSASDKSRSSADRLGDVHWIVRHLRDLVSKIVSAKDKCSPEEVRLAQLLEDRSYQFAPSATSQRPIHFDECVEHIQRAFTRVRTSWSAPLELQSLDHAYNAQSLDPWHVPSLIVDPEEKWLRQISAPGPQIITGMRGCGKTMLLLSLQFHARAAIRNGEPEEKRRQRLDRDTFVGLYVNGGKLLDSLGRVAEDLVNPYEKLIVGFALDATRSLRHLSEIDPKYVQSQWYRKIGAAVSAYLIGTSEELDIHSNLDLESALVRIMVSLNRGESHFRINVHPAVVFPHLAEAIRDCSSVWATKTVLFLLDDVSTRYFKQPPIQLLFSSLLFQSPTCAFKITSEAQTLELVLQSPGRTEKARAGRDYDIFDLGAEVLKQMKIGPSKSGVEFLEKILSLRTEHAAGMEAWRSFPPSVVLGDCTLKSIAESICATSNTSSKKKEVYYGIRALASVCVGDIGDIITLYEMIISEGAGKSIPLEASIQSGCYQDLCSRRLYHLDRRSGELRSFALSFAEASHQLLVESFDREKLKRGPRYRQYTKLYVRLTTDGAEWQFEKLRQLVDAGVFVLEGGSDTPRTKTKDSDPVRQFILSYRKLFGLSNFIGISDKDRFELSGPDLEDWLRNPKDGRAILTRSLASRKIGDEFENPDEDEPSSVENPVVKQQELWDLESEKDTLGSGPLPGSPMVDGEISPIDEDLEFARRKSPRVRKLTARQVKAKSVDCIVLALGFEDRSVGSLRRILRHVEPNQAIVVRYPEKGRSEEILKLLNETGAKVQEIFHKDIIAGAITELPESCLIDVSAMTKPVIFSFVKKALSTNRRILIAHTDARDHYPLNNDIARVLSAERERDHYTLLKELARLLSGESGPYDITMLQNSDADETRKRVLCAFATAKHERLLALLDVREYDVLDVFLIDNETPRSKLAAIAADVAAKKCRYSVTTPIDTNDLQSTIHNLTTRYHQWFVRGGCNLELALTGSKIQATAAAAVCEAFKLSYCWYVSPKQYDVGRFSMGVGPTEYFEISAESEE